MYKRQYNTSSILGESYPDIVKLAGGKPIIIKTKESNNFKINSSDLEENITEKTKWIILNSPSNPTGEVYSQDELKSLAEVIKKHPNLYVLSDDIYEYLLYKGSDKFSTIAQFDEDVFHRTVTMNGVSKAYSMTGWRIGYCAGPKKIIDAMRKLQSQSTSNPASISQWAAVEALNSEKQFLKNWLISFEERRDKVVEMINSADGLKCLKPKGAFYVFPSCKDCIGKKDKSGKNISNDEDFVTTLLENTGVAVVQGSAFGSEGYFRISYATSMNNLITALEKIENFCNHLS